jgi:hypothetical protein
MLAFHEPYQGNSYRLQCFLPLAQRLGDSEEADLLAMLLDDFYQDTFHGSLIPVERVARMIAQHSSEGANRRHSDGHPHHRSKH